ncbi:MAG: Ig domain protein, group 1 domain protein, partial [Bacteroidetes bacterium]|nr:Ig domain protein, group 1 domain protein [Bacteroidota bacterium]
ATARKGVVTFTNLSHTIAGEITIGFTSEPLVGDTSAAVQIQPSAAARLAFLQQPVETMAGAIITPPVTVRLRDAFGNDVETSGTSVRIALTSGTGSIDGALTQNTVSGVATFPDLSIDLAGSKRLTASSGSLTAATSDDFTITAKEAKALAFVQQPTSAEAATAIAPPVTVQLRDSLGNDVPLGGVSITIQLANGTGLLSGTTTKSTDDAGLATFSDLSIDQAGQKRLRATSGSLTSALSQAFAITAAREARLAFVQQPTGTVAGQSISPAVTVQLRDSLDNDVAKAGVSVQVALAPGSSGTLSGTTAQLTDASGRASFGNLSIDVAGNKALTASATGMTDAASDPFAVTAAPPSRLVFTRSPGTSTAGVPFPTQPALALQDQYQNLVTGVAQDITIAILTDAGQGGTLSGVTTVPVDTGTGTAVFAGLSIDKSGTGYTLTATGSTVSMVPGAVVSDPFTVAAAPATRVRVESEPDGEGTLMGDQSVSSGTSVTVYAIARDQFDNFVANIAANEWALLNRTGGVQTSDLVPSTDQRSATFTGAAAGTAVISVTVPGLTSIASGTITVVNNATPARIFVENAANGAGGIVQDQTLRSGDSIVVYAIARDLNDNFVSNVPAETWSLVEGTGGVSPADLVPSADRRSATLTGRLAGAARVRAVVPNLSPTPSGLVTIVAGSASAVTATAGTPQAAKVGTAFGARMVARVTDAAGNPVGGVAVTFNAPSTGASGSFDAGENTVVADTSGFAVAPIFTANFVAGTYVVTAIASGAPTFAVFELTNSANAVGRVTAVGGTPQTAKVRMAFPTRLAASVQDSFGNPVNGVALTFTAPAAGASGTFPGGELSATVMTDFGGIGTAPEFTAGSAAGTYTVTVSAAGLAGPAQFALTNTAGDAASVTAIQGNQQATEVNTPFPTGLSALVRDASGNTVSGVLVTFVAPDQGPGGAFTWSSTLNVATDTNGVATAPLFIANAIAGAFTVFAYAQDVVSPAPFELVNLPGTLNAFRIDAEGGGSITTQMAQVPFRIRVTAQDKFGNPATGFTGTVNLSSSGALMQGAGITPPFENGVLAGHSVAVQNAGRVVLLALRTGGAEAGVSDTFQVNNPVPKVMRLSPSTGARGESLNLTVNGSGFLQGVTSVILGNNITTYETVASDSQITVALNIGLDALEGPRPVLVINPPPGGGIVNVENGFVVEGILYPASYDLQGTIVFPTFAQSSDYQESDYRIVGFPGAASGSISQFLTGTRDQDWVAYWDNGDTSNYLVPFDGTSTFDLSPGRAFWLLNRGPLVIDATVPTVPLDSTTSVRISLHPGWNLISNPFTMTVAWADIQASNAPEALGAVYGFDGAFSVSDVLYPYEGYLFDNTGNLISLVIPFRQARLLKKEALDEGSWKVEVELTVGDYYERLAAFGVSPGAENGRDGLDWRRPRGIGTLPEAYFEHPEWGGESGPFATDIRGMIGDLQSWPLRIRATPRQPVQLSFVGVASIPEQHRVMLVDEDRGRSVDLRAAQAYTFTPTTPVSRFRVAVGSDEAVRGLVEEMLPREFSLGNNFPNPFNPSTTIPVTVPL